jgi:chromosome segregation ATPase
MPGKFSFVFVVVVFVFSSCVSKKKFLQMQSGRENAEEQVRQLTNENNTKAERIAAMIADYEQMKNELLENNAIKDEYIDSLNTIVFTLTQDLQEQQKSLEETSFTLDFEKQRLTNALESKDQTIIRLESQIEELENDISSRSSLISQKNYDISLMEDKVEQLEGQISVKDENIEELQAELQRVKEQVANLNDELQEKNSIITRLENNVKLLKNELGGGQQ